MDYVIVDLEATCWEDGTRVDRQEIIEIGSVRLDGPTLETIDEYSSFVRPVVEPVLSEFCRELTTIRQSDVDMAPDFKTALAAFLDWIGPEPVVLGSWGDYDLKQLEVECGRHGVAWPEVIHRHVNLKKVFSQWKNCKPPGMKAALRSLGYKLEGRHHRALDDARNIAKIAKLLLVVT